MFAHKLYPIIIPQYEHGKLAGHLAHHWGNAAFEQPQASRDAWIAGVTFHDWGYDLIDNVIVPGAPDSEWLPVMRRGVMFRFDDPLTDILVKLHIRRLLGWNASPEREKLIHQIDNIVAQRIPETGLTLPQCRWIDRITRFCDFVAFDFCLGRLGSREVHAPVKWDHEKTVPITYVIREDSVIEISPWPFDMPQFDGLLVAYRREGYPEVRQPSILPYRVVPHNAIEVGPV